MRNMFYWTSLLVAVGCGQPTALSDAEACPFEDTPVAIDDEGGRGFSATDVALALTTRQFRVDADGARGASLLVAPETYMVGIADTPVEARARAWLPSVDGRACPTEPTLVVKLELAILSADARFIANGMMWVSATSPAPAEIEWLASSAADGARGAMPESAVDAVDAHLIDSPCAGKVRVEDADISLSLVGPVLAPELRLIGAWGDPGDCVAGFVVASAPLVGMD
jgi:hypothetical protein